MELPKNFEAFNATLEWQGPTDQWPKPLQALWWDAKENWDMAHDLVDGAYVPMADAVHAYLHRKEGDEWNARYWYRRAGRPWCSLSLKEERKVLIEEILKHQ